jgi:ATP-binding cassette, subfamily C (CFTR/MRP), member 1
MRGVDHIIGPNGILASKARVLVTNAVSFVSQFDHICYLRRGAMIESGSFPELISNPSGEFYKLVTGHGGQGSSTPGPSSGTATPRAETEDGTLVASSRSSPGEKVEQLLEKFSEESFKEKVGRRKSFGAATLAPGQVIPQRGEVTAAAKKEHSEQGQVKRAVYAQYIQAASIWGFGLYILTSIAAQVASIMGTYALRAFGDENQTPSEGSSVSKYIWIYGILALSSVLFGLLGSLLLSIVCTLKASKALHDKARAIQPLRYLELNRFVDASSDYEGSVELLRTHSYWPDIEPVHEGYNGSRQCAQLGHLECYTHNDHCRR